MFHGYSPSILIICHHYDYSRDSSFDGVHDIFAIEKRKMLYFFVTLIVTHARAQLEIKYKEAKQFIFI
jgi:hypothetical protein